MRDDYSNSHFNSHYSKAKRVISGSWVLESTMYKPPLLDVLYNFQKGTTPIFPTLILSVHLKIRNNVLSSHI